MLVDTTVASTVAGPETSGSTGPDGRKSKPVPNRLITGLLTVRRTPERNRWLDGALVACRPHHAFGTPQHHIEAIGHRSLAASRSASKVAVMKRLSSCVLAAFIPALFDCAAPPTERPAGDTFPPLRVLFIGNSLTYTNDLPGTVAAIAGSAGGKISVESVTGGGLALIDHYKGATDAMAVIDRGGWDFVVLQQGPTSTTGLDRDTLIVAARLIDARVRARGGRTAVYMVWPSRERLAYFDNVRDSYLLAAQAINGVFMPAGEAWRAAWAQDPSIQLYDFDDLHPSQLGTYLAALTIYERLTGQDARALAGRMTLPGRTGAASAATVRVLQAAAHSANEKFR
jgi:hypothetical protein